MYLKLKDHNKCFTIILNYVSAIPPQLRHLLGEKSVVVGCLAVAMGEHTLPQGGGGELHSPSGWRGRTDLSGLYRGGFDH